MKKVLIRFAKNTYWGPWEKTLRACRFASSQKPLIKEEFLL